ncbi:MAG: hypothetical protein ACKOCE_07755, partial [Acidimicrobiia bacterium]
MAGFVGRVWWRVAGGAAVLGMALGAFALSGSASTILGTTGTTPFGIALDGAGNVYTANYGSNDVSKITPAGVSTILGTTGSSPSAIALDAAGNVYTANYDSD